VLLSRPDQDGRFTARPLPEGRLFAAALEYVDETQWRDPDFLETLVPLATPFTLGEGESKTIDLKMSERR
jgi:hypothetical protein